MSNNATDGEKAALEYLLKIEREKQIWQKMKSEIFLALVIGLAISLANIFMHPEVLGS